jgi:hypothetical protein
MRTVSYALLLSGLAVLLPLSNAVGGDFKLEKGFTLIFNGKDFDGWQPKGKKDSLAGKTEAFKGRFKAKDGSIVIDYEMKGDSYIETTKEFGKDVTIRFDFKPGKGCNNDFFIRGTKFDITPKVKGVKDDEWNSLEIIVTGDEVEHKINGESARKSKAKAGATPFMIRAEYGVIEVKNVRVKE